MSVDMSSIPGKKIRSVMSVLVGSNEETGQDIFDYSIGLDDGTYLILAPNRIDIIDQEPQPSFVPHAQIIDGPEDVAGEEIVAVIEGKRPADAKVNDYSNALLVGHQFALAISSGRILMNTFTGGGGTILHIEGALGVDKFLGYNWTNCVSGNAVTVFRPFL